MIDRVETTAALGFLRVNVSVNVSENVALIEAEGVFVLLPAALTKPRLLLSTNSPITIATCLTKEACIYSVHRGKGKHERTESGPAAAGKNTSEVMNKQP